MKVPKEAVDAAVQAAKESFNGKPPRGTRAAVRLALEAAAAVPKEPIEAATDCKECGHPQSHHSADQCWTTPEGHNTWGPTSCPCWWYEPVGGAA